MCLDIKQTNLNIRQEYEIFALINLDITNIFATFKMCQLHYTCT